MSRATTVISLDEGTKITVWPKIGPVSGIDMICLEIESPELFTIIGLSVESVDELIRALAAARVEIQPPTIPEKTVRNPRQPNVPDNADALARVAKSKPERIDGDEK